jgi:glycosyltransferase involved in cell wall biosynthesis
MQISAVINTKNAGRTLKRTLESLAFVDEIVVADMQSTDDTRLIAAGHGAIIYSVPDEKYVEPARNAAVAKASRPWILLVDADEVIPKSLGEKFQTIATADQNSHRYVAYDIPRKNIIFGRWIQAGGWWPDHQTRFFRKGAVRWGSNIHQPPQIDGEVHPLEPNPDYAITHYNYESINQYLEKLQRYTDAEQLGRTEMSNSPFRAFSEEFLRRLFAQNGIQQDKHGEALALLQGLYEAIVVMKSWERDSFTHDATRPAGLMVELQQFRRDLWYWMCTYRINDSAGLTKTWWKCRRKLGI